MHEIEAALASEPDAVALLMRRAALLDALGRTMPAIDAYVDVLRREPGHGEALANLGTLLFNTGRRSAARLTYEEALRRNGESVSLLVNLANALLELGETAPARDRYERALALDPDCARAHQGLSYALGRLGDEAGAELHRQRGFAAQPVHVVRYRGADAAPTVLVMLCAAGGNVATEFFLDDTAFAVVKVFADYYDPSAALPGHDVVFNAIGDAEMCGAALRAANTMTHAHMLPVVNAPARVLRTARVDVSERCAGMPGVVAPRTRLIARERFAAECELPTLVRSPGFHTGEHFERIESAHGIAAAIAALPGENLLAIEPLDARGADGRVRKYRVMAIDGELYPVHLAVASHWKVHYFTADLMHEAIYREEERAFLNDMAGTLGPAAVAALREIARELGLEYAGIDFALDPRGRVLLFEANATMKIVPPDAGPERAYRRAPVERALAAARAMVLRRAVAAAAGRAHDDPIAGE